MKNKNLNSLLVLSTLFIASCATTPDTYYPVSYREDYFAKERSPANVFTDCFTNVRNFFKPAKAVVPTPPAEQGFSGGKLRFPDGFSAEGTHIQYGFESEYLHEETEALLKNYMPIMFGANKKEEWLAMTHQERLRYFDNNIKSIFPYREKGQLIKISSDPELMEALPSSFVYDAGHFEIVLDPMDTAEELVHKIKVINKNLGVGSMQMTVSNPLNKKLLADNQTYRQEMKDELLGYYNFMNDMDTLGKLNAGYERYLVDPTAQTVKSFNHPWLGPMTAMKHKKLKNLIDGIIDDHPYSQDELKDISYKVVSHKFTGGLAFRPDVAYSKNRIASEVRDCHQNVKCIEDRIIRETYFLMKGKKTFTTFKSFNAFDSVNDFTKLPFEAQTMLKTLFPKYGQFTQIELELFRNFAYPLRDWSKHVDALGMPELKGQIESAQQVYSESVLKISQEFLAGKVTKKEAQAQVMGALGEFSKNSGLYKAMRDKFKDLANPEELKALESLKLTLFLQEHFGSTRVALLAFSLHHLNS